MKKVIVNKEKQESGITLIALIVTIIVLIILSGVVISMITGKNGLWRKAREAEKIYDMSKVKELLNLAINEDYIEKMTNKGDYKEYQLAEKIIEAIPEAQVAKDMVKIGNYLFKLNENKTSAEEFRDLTNVEYTEVKLEQGKNSSSKNIDILRAAFKSNTDNYIYIPEGTYYFGRTAGYENDGTIYVNPNTTSNVQTAAVSSNDYVTHIKMDDNTKLVFIDDYGDFDTNGNDIGYARISVQNASNVIIEGGTIDAGSQYTTDGTEITEEYAANNIRDKQTGWYAGAHSTIYITDKSKNIFIDNVEILYGRSTGIYVGGEAEGVSITNCKASNNYIGQGIAVTSAKFVNITNCDFENIWEGIDVEPARYNQAENVLISGITVKNCTVFGVVAQTAFIHPDNGNKYGNIQARESFAKQVNDIKVEKIKVYPAENILSDAISFGGVYGLALENVYVENCRNTGIVIRDSNDINIDTIEVRGSQNMGLQIYNPGIKDKPFDNKNIIINNAKIYGNKCIPTPLENGDSESSYTILKGAINIILDSKNSTTDTLSIKNSEVTKNGTSGIRIITMGTIDNLLIDNVTSCCNNDKSIYTDVDKTYMNELGINVEEDNNENNHPYGLMIEGGGLENGVLLKMGIIKYAEIKNSILWENEGETTNQLYSIYIRAMQSLSKIKLTYDDSTLKDLMKEKAEVNAQQYFD